MSPSMSKRLVVLFASVLGACSGKYVRPTTQERITSSPERLARGGYLVNQAMSCGACHTTHAGDFVLTGERADKYLAGNAFELKDEGIKLWIPNITSDVDTGLGGWSDDEIMRALRDGVAKDGHLMFPLMPFSSYRHVSDEDLRAIVAYLRSVPPVKSPRPFQNELGFFLSFLVNRGVMHQEPVRSVPEPDRRNQLKYGEYVMRLGHCWECHSRTGRAPRDVGEAGFLGGWSEPDDLPGVGKVYMRNLTPDPETGLGKYTAAQLERALRDGRRLDGKRFAPPMSFFTPHLSGLSQEDMDALVAYLRSVPPAKNAIPERALLPAFEKTLEAQ
jgi:cytochrome c553